MAKTMMRTLATATMVVSLAAAWTTTHTTKTLTQSRRGSVAQRALEERRVDASSAQQKTLRRRRRSAPQSSWLNLRKSFASTVAREWLGGAVRRGQVTYESAEVDVETKDDVVLRVVGQNVSWLGGHESPRLKLSRVDVELLSPHERALSKGRKGGFSATVSLSARDLDQSVWIRQVLRRLLIKVLAEIAPEKKLKKFRAGLDGDSVRLDAQCEDGLRFAITSKVEAENGAASLRDPTLELERSHQKKDDFYRPAIAKGMVVPAPVVERLGALYLSTVAVDATRGNCRLESAAVVGERLELTLVSGPSSEAVLEKHVLFFERRAREPLRHSRRSRASSSLRRLLPTEWRVDWDSAVPLRHAFMLGDQLPWILNPRNSAPLRVSAAFACFGLALAALAVPETGLQALAFAGHRSARALKATADRGARTLFKIATAPALNAVLLATRGLRDGLRAARRALRRGPGFLFQHLLFRRRRQYPREPRDVRRVARVRKATRRAAGPRPASWHRQDRELALRRPRRLSLVSSE